MGLYSKIYDGADKFLDSIIEMYPPNIRPWVYKFKNAYMWVSKNIISNLILASVTFWVFGRMRKIIGYDETIFTLAVLNILYLRFVSSQIMSWRTPQDNPPKKKKNDKKFQVPQLQ